MKEYECTGCWYLPGNDQALVAGTLRVASDGDLRLSLIGQLAASGEDHPGKSHRVVLGSVDESPGGNAVTLTGCVWMQSTTGSYHGAREEYRASRGYFGAHLENEADFKFRSFLIQLGGLSTWASPLSGLHRETAPLLTSKREGQTIPIATYRVPRRPSGRVTGGKVTLNMGVSSRSEAQVFSFREEANLLIELDESRSADQINSEYVHPLQNLMTFVSDRPQEVERLSAWRSEKLTDFETNPEIRIVGPRVQPDGGEDRKAVRDDQMLFTFANVDFSTFVERWLRLSEKYSDAFNTYFGIQYGPPSFIDMTYALVAQSILLYYGQTKEGLEHREGEERLLKSILSSVSPQQAEWLVDHLGVKPYPPFQSVLLRLVDRYGDALDPILSRRRDAFVNQATNTLHYVQRPNAVDYLAASHGSDLYRLMQKLRFLIKACFLTELGFPSDQVVALLQRNEYYQHISALEATREKARTQQLPPAGSGG
jgi:hypothetical protein